MICGAGVNGDAYAAEWVRDSWRDTGIVLLRQQGPRAFARHLRQVNPMQVTRDYALHPEADIPREVTEVGFGPLPSKALDTCVRKLSCIFCVDVRMAGTQNSYRLDAQVTPRRRLLPLWPNLVVS